MLNMIDALRKRRTILKKTFSLKKSNIMKKIIESKQKCDEKGYLSAHLTKLNMMCYTFNKAFFS